MYCRTKPGTPSQPTACSEYHCAQVSELEEAEKSHASENLGEELNAGPTPAAATASTDAAPSTKVCENSIIVAVSVNSCGSLLKKQGVHQL